MPFLVGWVFIGSVWAVDAAWLIIGGFSISGVGVSPIVVLASGVAALALRRRYPRVAMSCHALAQNLVAAPALRIFYYLCATPGRPLVDVGLSAADRALGFEWLRWYELVAAEPTVFASLGILYFYTWALQTAALPILLPIVNPRRNGEYILLFGISLAVSAIVAMIWPAEGAMFFNIADVNPVHGQLIDGLRDFTALRNGSMTQIMLTATHGIIAFPSFHTATAIIYTYAVRGAGRLYRLVVCMNVMMLISIPIFGGHYLVDMIAGAIIAVGTIAVVRALTAPMAARAAVAAA